MPISPNIDQIVAAIQQWPQNQQLALDQVRPLADSGDRAAIAMLAYMLGPQMGRWQEGIPYARRAVADGVTFIAYIYGQNLLGVGDTSLRSDAASFMAAALADGWPVDAFSGAIQAAQHADPQTAATIVEIALSDRVTGARRRWDEMIAQAAGNQRVLSEAAAAVDGERERVVQEIDAHREAVSEQRRSVERLAQQVGVLANKAAGGALAENYARRAEKVELTATRYTWASIILAVLIAAGATVATLLSKHAEILDDAAAKAAVGIPLVALNLYLGRLAAQYRQEAVDLRHIELQFNTANPFLADLDDERRKEVLSQLAPRFFPGQALPGKGKGSDQSPDLAQVITASLLERLSLDVTKKSTGNPSPPAAAEPLE